MNKWFYLILAIVFEVTGTTFMKLSSGFSKIVPSALMLIFYILSLTMLTFALKKLDVGVSYAIWSGLGTALITIIGIIFFKESFNFIKIFAIILIITGVVILQLQNSTS